MLKRQIGGRWYLPWVVRLGAHLGREQVCFQGSVENLRTSAICLLPCDQKGLQENPVRRSTLPHGWTTGSWSLQWQTPCNVTRGPGWGREGCVLASTTWAFLLQGTSCVSVWGVQCESLEPGTEHIWVRTPIPQHSTSCPWETSQIHGPSAQKQALRCTFQHTSQVNLLPLTSKFFTWLRTQLKAYYTFKYTHPCTEMYAPYMFASTCEMTQIIQLLSGLLMINIQYQKNIKTLPA